MLRICFRTRPNSTVWHQRSDVTISTNNLILSSGNYQDWPGKIRWNGWCSRRNLADGENVRLVHVNLEHFGIKLAIEWIQNITDAARIHGHISRGKGSKLLRLHGTGGSGIGVFDERLEADKDVGCRSKNICVGTILWEKCSDETRKD
jgi:hypothetical protein